VGIRTADVQIRGAKFVNFFDFFLKKGRKRWTVGDFHKKCQYSLEFEGLCMLNPCNGALFQLEMSTFLCVFNDLDPEKTETRGPNNKGANLPGHGFS